MDGQFTVREARETDRDEIWRVNRRAWKAAYAGILPTENLEWSTEESAEQLEWIETVFTDDQMAEFVAEAGERVVGFAEFLWKKPETRSFVEPGEAELRAIYVDPDRWGVGIGTELLERATDSLRVDLDGIALSTLLANDRAQAFYDQRGFERDGKTTMKICGNSYEAIVFRRPR